MEEKQYSMAKFSLMTSLLAVLNENRKDDSYFLLAQYFLQHFHELDKLNIYDVAEECYISRSGIRRFCKSIGFDNFSELKEADEWTRHREAFIGYANRADFREYLNRSIQEMMRDIDRMADLQSIDKLARRLHDSGDIVLLTSDYSSNAAREFQQEMVVMGKIVRILTDSYADPELLDNMHENDLLITSSATGNYAIAVDDMLRGLKPCKVLVTLNHSKRFYSNYHFIFYLSQKTQEHADISTGGHRSVYTKYGINYFFDLLYHRYVRLYLHEQEEK